MPRLSLWRENHSLDYKYFDRRISEYFTVGGTGISVHKYMGTKSVDKNDATKPEYINQSEKNIQDLLFLENRDRIYDSTIYQLRGIYTVSDNDFDLTQFGLFLTTGILFMNFHINDMVDLIGRRIMNGDVLELRHLTDFDALNDLPIALKRFFVVGDCSRASDGFSPTWWPHVWRCKLTPMVDSQEYKDIVNKIQTSASGDEYSLKELLSTYDRYSAINDAIIAQAENDVPKSGYDTSTFFTQPVDPRTNEPAASHLLTTDDVLLTTADNDLPTADEQVVTPTKKIRGYLTGDGLAPNGIAVQSGISFPAEPAVGDYCLRVDYFPNRLFRYDGRRWVKVEDSVRSGLTPGAANNQTQRSGFVNNQNTFEDAAGTHPERQSLSQALRPREDN